jgi:hypothetical protein
LEVTEKDSSTGNIKSSINRDYQISTETYLKKMEFNSFLFPAPKCNWDKDDYEGEMVWVPAPKSNLTWDKFKKILDIKKERVRS